MLIKIQILTDCESYIGVFADFEDSETKEKHAFIANLGLLINKYFFFKSKNKITLEPKVRTMTQA